MAPAPPKRLSEATRDRIVLYILFFFGLIIASFTALSFFLNFSLFSIFLSTYLLLLSVYNLVYLQSQKSKLPSDIRFKITTYIHLFNIGLALLLIGLAAVFYHRDFGLLTFMRYY
jgi:hypothetical protein